MYQIDFANPVPVHFIGIGGISMSGLASVLIREGFRVSGSDARSSWMTEQLSKAGAQIYIGHAVQHVSDDCQVVVYSAAIHPDNPEYAAAAERGIPMLTRAELLGQIMRNHQMSVAVAGTHGKTTTTSLLAQITLQAHMDPTISVGGMLPAIGGNFLIGRSETFITEACEYTNSFLSLYPKIAIILNIDEDHLDFFKDLADIRSSFRRFAELVEADGALVISADIPDLDEFTAGLPCKVLSFGIDKGDYRAENISFDARGCAGFDLISPDSAEGRGAKERRITLSVPGIHNVSNSLAAIAAADFMGIAREDIIEGLKAFKGTDRRFQYKGNLGSVVVVDDYAHHPAEIRATLEAAAMTNHHEIWCAFQPHTYTRTLALMDDFADALSRADHVLLADIYAAREINTTGVSSDMLREKISALGCDCRYFESFSAMEDYLREHLRENDLLITMGAGDINEVGEDLLREQS